MTSPPPADTARQYRELLEINRLITSSLDLGVVLATVTRQAAALLRSEAAALWLREDQALKVAATHQLPGGARDVQVPLGPGVMARIRDLGRAAGLAECVGVPLVLRGDTVGVLAAYRRDAATPTAEDEALLSALADQAAVALENARIYQQLQRSEAQFRGFIERLPDGVFINRDGRVAYANRALSSLLGYADPAALVGTPITQLYHPDDMPTILERIRVLESGGAVPPRELRIACRDGSFCEVETTGIRVQFEDRPAIIVIVRDLAERKLAEREREEAYRRLRVIIDLAPVGIALSSDARHWDENVRAKQLFGRPIDPSVDASQYVGALLDATERPLAYEELPGVRALRGEQIERVEMRLRRPDGRLVPILVNATHIPGGGRTPPGAVVVFEDISALKDLERLRTEWSALIVHDLRQPLHSIDLYAQLVIQQAPDDLALQRRAQQIRALTRRLSRMVQDLVDFTRLEARQLTLDRTSADLAELVKEATERIALEVPERPIQLHVRGAPAWVDVDPDRIAQIMDNLLTNAIKYGDSGTPIRVEVETGAGRASVSVTNQGPGIAPEHMPYLFGRFQRGRDAERRGVKGLGLGLYITRELVEAHQGQIVAESTPGATTTFRFTLALAPQVRAGPTADRPSR